MDCIGTSAVGCRVGSRNVAGVEADADQNGHRVRLAGVYVGQPEVIGQRGGEDVVSAIAKKPVTTTTVDLGLTNLAGDRQANPEVHGGPDKAVYFYAADHYPTWQAEGFDVDLGGLGENVAVHGVTEREVRIGDIWRWGGALVQVSEPRAPCHKLSVHAGRKDIGVRMIDAGRSGWYVRVLQTGTVPTDGWLDLVERDEEAPTVFEAFARYFDKLPDRSDAELADLLRRLVEHPPLADGWRQALLARHGSPG
jgi:MOSC domain-containing protein YiiM